MFQHLTPGLGKQHPIALCTGAPHCRAFRSVQHPKLDHTFISNNPTISTQSINFSHNLPFCNSTHCRITTHLCNRLHIHGNKQCFTTHIGTCSSSFTACMTGTNNYNIVFWKHGCKGTKTFPFTKKDY